MTTSIRSTTAAYSLYGALFGLSFPLVATSLDAWLTYAQINGTTLAAVQASNPLLWIINSAPLFLGIFAGIAGVRQERVENLAAQQEQIIAEQTKDLRQALADAQEADQARTSFLANISEGISTPLDELISRMDELAEQTQSEPQSGLVDNARSNCHSLLVSLSNLVDYTKISAGTLSLNEQPMQLSQSISEAVELAATKEAVQIEFAHSDAADEVIYGDEVRIRQILTNLLNLSLKYTKRGLIQVSVQRCEPQGGTVGTSKENRFEFVVDDNGIGLPTEQLDRLLRPLNHVSHSTHKYGATGLGLAISKTLCEMMGGHIWGEYKGKRLGNRYMFSIAVKIADKEGPSSVAHRQALVHSGSANVVNEAEPATLSIDH